MTEQIKQIAERYEEYKCGMKIQELKVS